MTSGHAIGIDLGTTYSCVGVFINGKVEIITNDQGNRVTPSCVAFTEDERLVGETAANQISLNPQNTVYDIKRLMGRRYENPCVQADMKQWPFTVIEESGKPKIQVFYKKQLMTFFPEEISSMVLSKMKETAEDFLGNTVRHAVITVPAFFNDSQRQATQDAARMANLEVLRLINEPTAAALAYGLDLQGEKNILVFDLGGGTLDVSVLTFANGIFSVKSTSGDTHLGGEDFDDRLVEHFVKEFERKYDKDMSGDKRAVRRLRTACEKAKRILSSTTKTTIVVDSLFHGVDFHATLTRAKFDDLNLSLFQSTLAPLERALEDAHLDKAQIDEVILVGGSTRIPKIQTLLQEFFGGKKLNKSVNPDEAVAFGAAVQAAILSGNGSNSIKDLLIKDVTPLSLGIQTSGGVMSVLIERNSTIPISVSRIYPTQRNNQTRVGIRVYEGERSMTKDNNLLGMFYLEGIPPVPRGIPQIEITFEMDANGMLKVSAEEKTFNIRNDLTITRDTRLPTEEIGRIVQDAMKHQQEDEEVRARVLAKNGLEMLADDMKSSLEDEKFKTRVSESEKKAVLQKVEEVLAWLDHNPDAREEALEGKKREIEKEWVIMRTLHRWRTRGQKQVTDEPED